MQVVAYAVNYYKDEDKYKSTVYDQVITIKS